MTWLFEYPLAFLILAIYLICKILCKKKSTEIYFSNAFVLESIIKKRKDFQTILEFLVLFFLVFALASPISKEQILKNTSLGYEIVLSLDASESMRTDNRFEITKSIVDKFIDKRVSDNLALTLFAQDVYVAVPFTYDKKPLKDILKYMQLGVAGSVGTALNEALYTSSNLFKDIKNPSKILILLTDGINTKENIPLDVAIANAKKQNIKVYTIAIGNEGEYNKEALELIANQTNGKFFETSKPEELLKIYENIDTLEKSKIETSTLTKTKYYFQYPLFLSLIFLFILILNYIFKYKIDKKVFLLILSFIFVIIAFSRPTFSPKEKSSNSLDVEFIVALDVSKSMLAKDIKPNRFEFAKQKTQNLIQNLNGEKITLLAFSNQPYMIIPSTNNYEIIKTLTQNITLKNINQNGTNFLSLLKATNEILNHRSNKVLLLLTDGGENENFDEEISFAKQNNIRIYIYDISTKNGSVIEFKDELLKEKNGNIIISKTNENIEKFADATDGIYQNYSLKNDDFKTILEQIKKDFDNNLNLDDLQDKKELFYLFLLFALVLFFLARFDMRSFK